MLGRHDPQMDLADAVLWTGKIEPKPLRSGRIPESVLVPRRRAAFRA
jgi:hypothetical protein